MAVAGFCRAASLPAIINTIIFTCPKQQTNCNFNSPLHGLKSPGTVLGIITHKTHVYETSHYHRQSVTSELR